MVSIYYYLIIVNQLSYYFLKDFVIDFYIFYFCYYINEIYFLVGDKPVFQCELCPTTCGRKTDLRIHVQKLHTSDKPLKCKRCGKTFPDR